MHARARACSHTLRKQQSGVWKTEQDLAVWPQQRRENRASHMPLSKKRTSISVSMLLFPSSDNYSRMEIKVRNYLSKKSRWCVFIFLSILNWQDFCQQSLSFNFACSGCRLFNYACHKLSQVCGHMSYKSPWPNTLLPPLNRFVHRGETKEQLGLASCMSRFMQYLIVVSLHFRILYDRSIFFLFPLPPFYFPRPQ